MAKGRGKSNDSLEDLLSKAVDNALYRVIKETTAGTGAAKKAYGDLKDPILEKLMILGDDQAFEVTFQAANVATAFANGFNEKAPRTSEYVYSAIPEENVVHLNRSKSVGFIIKDGKVVPI